MYVYLQSYTYTLEHLRWCTAQDLGKLGMLETQIGKLLKGITSSRRRLKHIIDKEMCF